MANPLFRSVNITPVNTNLSLLTLLRAVDAGVERRCQYVQIQVAIDAPGGVVVRVVNQTVGADNDCGVELVSTQALTIGTAELNTVNLENIHVRSDIDNTRLNIAMVVK